MKKIILGLGALTAVIAPVATAAQCGGQSGKVTKAGNQDQQVKSVDASVVMSVQTTPSKKIIVTINPAIGNGNKVGDSMIFDAVRKLPGMTNGSIDLASFTGADFVVGGRTIGTLSRDAILGWRLLNNYSEFKSLVNTVINNLHAGANNLLKQEYMFSAFVISGENKTYFTTSESLVMPQDVSINSKDEFVLKAHDIDRKKYSFASTAQGGHNNAFSSADDKIYFSQEGQESNKRAVSVYFKNNHQDSISSFAADFQITRNFAAFIDANKELNALR